MQLGRGLGYHDEVYSDDGSAEGATVGDTASLVGGPTGLSGGLLLMLAIFCVLIAMSEED